MNVISNASIIFANDGYGEWWISVKPCADDKFKRRIVYRNNSKTILIHEVPFDMVTMAWLLAELEAAQRCLMDMEEDAEYLDFLIDMEMESKHERD